MTDIEPDSRLPRFVKGTMLALSGPLLFLVIVAVFNVAVSRGVEGALTPWVIRCALIAGLVTEVVLLLLIRLTKSERLGSVLSAFLLCTGWAIIPATLYKASRFGPNFLFSLLLVVPFIFGYLFLRKRLV